MNIRDILGLAPILPLVRLDEPSQAVPLAQALSRAGLRAVEINFHSRAAMAAVEAIRKSVPEAIVGVGALGRAADFAAAGRAGAQFGVTPGWTPELAAAARSARFPVLPSAITPSEVIAARHAGVEAVRVFPARLAGGPALLAELAAQLPDMLYCPAGGIEPADVPAYRALGSVISIGAAWVAPDSLVTAGDWTRIEALAREAALMGRPATTGGSARP
jgi:2-dehydro-3-deoxyphosphogluconate aldolase / (4S)-4-hydroxy-2-oxoglutarate aldolase